MNKRSYIRKVIFFVVMAIALLCITASAMADECEPGAHNFAEIITVKPTCNTEGKAITKCTICGYIVANSERTVSMLPHDYAWKTSVAPQCQVKGQEHQVCKVCGAIGEIRDIAPLDHDWGAWAQTTAPSCTAKGVETRICKLNAAHQETRDIAALGHDMGDWVVIKAPTCTETGIERKSCRRTGCTYTEDRTIDALGHDYGAWKVTVQPTCEGTGTEERVCSRNSSHKDTRNVAPLGHLWGPEVTTPSTCTTPGTVRQTCQRDSSHVQTVRTLPLDPDAHDWGPYVTTTKPNCTNKGVETSTCRLNSAHTRTRELPVIPEAHVWDGGTVTKQPTITEEGIRVYTCTINSAHTRTEKIGTIPLNNNTLCAFGPRLRDMNLYDEWYMFTPFDASKQGTQTYDLVASNTFIVGKVTLTIKDGNLKIDYSLLDNAKFKVTLEFFTVLGRINDLTQYEPEELLNLRLSKGQTINLEENFGDDTNLVLYFCSRCDYTYSQKFSYLTYYSTANQALLSRMMDLMD